MSRATTTNPTTPPPTPTQGFAPFQVTFGRLLFGTAVLAAALAVKRERLPRGTHMGASHGGRVPPERTLSEDRPTRVRVAGLGLGFIGVLTVLGAWQGFHGLDTKGTALALLASLSYPIGWIYVRRTLAGSSHSHLSLSGAQLLLATLQLAVVTPLFTSIPDDLPSGPLLAIVALGALGTGLAMLLRYGLVAETGPTTDRPDGHVLHPGHHHDHGRHPARRDLTWSTPLGAVVVLAGAALTQVGTGHRARPGR